MYLYIPLAIIVVLATIGAAVAIDTRLRKARADQEQADILEAARLRLKAEGVDVDAVLDGTGGGNVYASRHAAATFEDRTAVLVVDPTLSATDVADMVEHIAPGVGSVASFVAAVEDTRMRTAAEVAELHAAEEAAYAEAPAQDDRLFFAQFEAGLEAALTGAQRAWTLIDAWVERYHGDVHYAACEHCEEALHEQSDEYAQLVGRIESEHTGEISMAALLAARV